jgi:integrase
MALSDTRIRNAKPSEKPYKLADGGGLYLEIKPTGAKLWRYRYRISGKENVFAISAYPAVSLSDARQARDIARKLVKQGIHPAHQRKAERIRREHEGANTFEAIAREWLDHNAERWTPRTKRQRERMLERDVFPRIGSLPMRQVTPALVLDTLKRIDKRAPSFAVLAKQCIGGIANYAVSTLRGDGDPSAPLKGVLKVRPVKHKTALKLSEIPDFVKAIDLLHSYFPNKVALHLVVLTLVRSTEALRARWSEIDLEMAEWRIPAERMKKRRQHTVPLPKQAIELLKRLKAVTGNHEYLFPNRNDPRRPVSIGVLWKAVESMGYTGKFSPHGIRATGSTVLNEMGFRPDVIESQLAHQERSRTRASYNQAEYLQERREMMQAWADLIDSLVVGGGK